MNNIPTVTAAFRVEFIFSHFHYDFVIAHQIKDLWYACWLRSLPGFYWKEIHSLFVEVLIQYRLYLFLQSERRILQIPDLMSKVAAC